MTPKKIKVIKSFLIRIARVSGNTLFFQVWYIFLFVFSLYPPPFFSSFDIVCSFFGFALLLLFFYIFVFILIENFPLKKIARLYGARLYFVVDKEKRLLEKLVELLQFYIEIVIFYPKSSLLSSFSSTENAHFCYFDLARKL
jgi:hypothetical protein